MIYRETVLKWLRRIKKLNLQVLKTLMINKIVVQSCKITKAKIKQASTLLLEEVKP